MSSLSPWLPSFPIHLLKETHHIVGFPPSPTHSPFATLFMSPLFFEHPLLFVFLGVVILLTFVKPSSTPLSRHFLYNNRNLHIFKIIPFQRLQ